jgi:hypothetical protein
MNTNHQDEQGHTHFSTQSNFSERCIASCRRLLAQMERVRTQIVAEFRDRLGGDQRVLELAINEAEALAWQTEFPQLVFPTLATEKAYAVAGWHARQQALRSRATSSMLVAA